jgi:hypothetical protein
MMLFNKDSLALSVYKLHEINDQVFFLSRGSLKLLLKPYPFAEVFYWEVILHFSKCGT